MEFVRKHPWPGNVRQLYNTLMQAAVMTDGDVIDRQDVADAIAEVPGKATVDLLEHPSGEGFSLEDHLEEIQRHYLRRAMKEAGGVKKRAAELLGYQNYQTLAAQLDRLEVEYLMHVTKGSGTANAIVGLSLPQRPSAMIRLTPREALGTPR